jgi:hypothetical protein
MCVMLGYIFKAYIFHHKNTGIKRHKMRDCNFRLSLVCWDLKAAPSVFGSGTIRFPNVRFYSVESAKIKLIVPARVAVQSNTFGALGLKVIA